MKKEPAADHARNVYECLYPLTQKESFIAQQDHHPHQTSDRSGYYSPEYNDPSPILLFGQQPDLPRPHAGKDHHTDSQQTNAEHIPSDHQPRHRLHMNRDQHSRYDRRGAKTDDQLVYGRQPVKPVWAFDVFSHTAN
jgi:hypothetical protein